MDCETADSFKKWTSLKEQGLIGHVHPFHLFVISQPLKALLLMCLLASLFFPENQVEMSISPLSPFTLTDNACFFFSVSVKG